MATNRQRYTVSVDDDLFQAIENFRFERRYQTRSEATEELLRLGVETMLKELNKEDKSDSFKANASPKTLADHMTDDNWTSENDDAVAAIKRDAAAKRKMEAQN